MYWKVKKVDNVCPDYPTGEYEILLEEGWEPFAIESEMIKKQVNYYGDEAYVTRYSIYLKKQYD